MLSILVNRSTVTQLLIIVDKSTEYLEIIGEVDVEYKDFKKAFDEIRHKQLITKKHSHVIIAKL